VHSPVDLVNELRETLYHTSPQNQAAGIKGIDDTDGAGDEGLGHSLNESKADGLRSLLYVGGTSEPLMHPAC
jgi:hypothetical protein